MPERGLSTRVARQLPSPVLVTRHPNAEHTDAMDVRIRGVKLEYRRVLPPSAGAATSTSIVLLHEGLGSMSTWKDFPEALAQATGHAVVAYSRHGYGGSDPVTAPRSADFMHAEACDALPDLLRALGVQRPVLLGHSDGASIALIHAASGHPVSGLVLIAPHVFVEARTVEGITAARAAFRTGDLRRRLARHHDHPDAMFGSWCDIWLDPAFRNWNIESCTGEIDVPMLLVQSEEDPYGTLAQLESIEARARGPVHRRVMPGGGHAPHVEHRGQVLDEVARFLRGRAPVADRHAAP